jgi:Zn-finger nucleic acid-binding protein
MAVDVCTQCGGTYFDQGEFSTLARKCPDQLRKLEAVAKPTEAQPASAAAAAESLRCPGCAGPMGSYQYAECSGVWLHRCPRCNGVWVDDGELEAIEAHIEKGHRLLKTGATAMSDSLGSPPEALPGLNRDRWTSIGAVAGVLGRHLMWPL